MMPAMMHAPKAGEKVDLEIRYYGTKPGSYQLYDDDGETFDYEKGAYSFREIRITKNSSGNFAGTIADPVKGKPNTIGNITWKFMSK
jgi:alpha-D-xyloside xylohydrolase